MIKNNKIYKIDAAGKSLGRLAALTAKVLMGKDKAYFVRNEVSGQTVEIINAAKVKVTGKKETQKKYYSHSGHPGGLKTKKLSTELKVNPGFAIKHAVKGMLPKNKLQREMLNKLKISL